MICRSVCHANFASGSDDLLLSDANSKESSNLTLVSVPVLSKTKVSSSASRSKTSPPRRRRPLLAPREEATSTAVGVARPRAQGQATTSTFTASLRPRNVPLATPAASRAPGKMLAPARNPSQTQEKLHTLDRNVVGASSPY